MSCEMPPRGSTAEVDALDAVADGGEHLVGYRLQLVAEHSYGQLVAEDFHRVALLAGNVGHVNHTYVHANVAHVGSPLPVHQAVARAVAQVVMKQMTSVSIILMFPTLIASIFGMNLISGMENYWWGFPLVIVLSFIVTGVFYGLFRFKTWI